VARVTYEHERIASHVERMISSGVLRPLSRVPSVHRVRKAGQGLLESASVDQLRYDRCARSARSERRTRPQPPGLPRWARRRTPRRHRRPPTDRAVLQQSARQRERGPRPRMLRLEQGGVDRSARWRQIAAPEYRLGQDALICDRAARRAFPQDPAAPVTAVQVQQPAERPRWRDHGRVQHERSDRHGHRARNLKAHRFTPAPRDGTGPPNLVIAARDHTNPIETRTWRHHGRGVFNSVGACSADARPGPANAMLAANKPATSHPSRNDTSW
jgi:hypothetical protein